jgi:hypothetical protein
MNEATNRLLCKSKIARLATVSSGGLPNITPLWFVLDGGRLYMNTREASIAVRNLKVHPEVVVLVELGRGRVARIRGSAQFTRVGRTRWRAAFLAALKYYLSPGGIWDTVVSIAQMPSRVRYYLERAGESGVIVMTPMTFELLKPTPE